ncbi:NADAR family protein [Burkholderia stabilis]|uniref:NADAR family protein n=1 Tax=Burkholderia stabilis TaxID=95485 RepID=UPI001F4A72E9|nr:NADAR family protein [Burkholderia stabilis]
MDAMKQAIEFYRANEKPYGAFSNLFRREIEINDSRFPTVEHGYQSLKPRDPRVRDWLLAAPAPSLVALAAHVLPSNDADPAEIMGRTADALLGFHTRPGWSRLRYPWMLACLRAKFVQHADLRELLLATGDAQIVEAGRIDDDAGRRWGIVNGRGQNYLGRMLMRVRAELAGTVFPDADLDARLHDGAEPLRAALIVTDAAAIASAV